MTGLCGFKGYFSRFAITDFTHHDNVGILAQQRAQYSLKSETGTWMNLCLVKTCDRDLYWIFHATEVNVRSVSGLQRTVQRDRFTASGRSGDQNQPLRLLQRL